MKFVQEVANGFLCLCICGMIFMPSLAFAQNFKEFSIDIPSDWIVEEQGNSYIFTEPKEQCVINVSVTLHQNSDFNELGIVLYQSMQGQNPKADDGGFSFFVNTKSDVLSSARFTYHGSRLVFVVASGACVDFQNIVNTLKIVDGGSRPFPILDPRQTLKAR